MPLLEPARAILSFLHHNPQVRGQIKAAPNKTLLYAGKIVMPAWQEIGQLKALNPDIRDKVLLPDVLAKIFLHGHPYPHLLAWAQGIDKLHPWKENGFIVWRALSGIFASNAVGAVSFYVGSGVTKETKVFAATEISILSRNPNIDEVSRDALGYYQRCLQTKKADMNFGFFHG